MTRLNPVNINNEKWFDYIWKLENTHRYDRVRMEQFLLDVSADEKILDVGAGCFGIAQFAVDRGIPGFYTAIDFSVEAKRITFEALGIDKARDLIYDIGNALELPYPDGKFHRVCSGELIEHMEKPEDLVAELFRVCRHGGRVIIGTLNEKCEAAIAHGPYPEHVWAFTPDDLIGMVAVHAEARYWLCPGGQYHFVEGVKR